MITTKPIFAITRVGHNSIRCIFLADPNSVRSWPEYGITEEAALDGGTPLKISCQYPRAIPSGRKSIHRCVAMMYHIYWVFQRRILLFVSENPPIMLYTSCVFNTFPMFSHCFMLFRAISIEMKKSQFLVSSFLDGPWTRASSLLPPGSCHQLLTRSECSTPGTRRH